MRRNMNMKKRVIGILCWNSSSFGIFILEDYA
jgi:hypothetical protein